MSNKRKRSRWDEDDAQVVKVEEKPEETTSETINTVKTKIKVNLEDEKKYYTGISSSTDAFKWGECIKKEHHEDGGRRDEDHDSKDGKEEVKGKKVKVNFGLTGALAKDEKTGNMRNGVVLKYSDALDASAPTLKWRLYIFDGDDLKETLHIHRESSYLIGKDRRVCDVLVDHHSISKQHAVIVFRNVEVVGGRVNKPYLLDLNSTNKTTLNRNTVDDSRYYELREKDCLRFGACALDYVLLHDSASR